MFAGKRERSAERWLTGAAISIVPTLRRGACVCFVKIMSREAARKSRIHQMVQNAVFSENGANKNNTGKKKKYRKKKRHEIEEYTENSLKDSIMVKYVAEQTTQFEEREIKKHNIESTLENILEDSNIVQTQNFEEKKYEDHLEQFITENIFVITTEKNTTELTANNPQNDNNNIRVEGIISDPVQPSEPQEKKSNNHNLKSCTENIINNSSLENYITEQTIHFEEKEIKKHDGKRILENISEEFSLEQTNDLNDNRHKDQPEKRTTENILEREITKKNTTEMIGIDSKNDNNNNNCVKDIISDPVSPRELEGNKSDGHDIEPCTSDSEKYNEEQMRHFKERETKKRDRETSFGNKSEEFSIEHTKYFEDKRHENQSEERTTENYLEVIITEENITKLTDNNAQNDSINNCAEDILSDSIPPSEPLFDFSDFSAGSSDNYIPNDSEFSDESVPRKKRRNKKNKPVNNVVVAESCSEANISDTEAKTQRKKRKSLKERREDRLDRLLKRNAGLPYFTKTGKFIERRNLGTLSKCRSKCKDRIPENVREYIFEEYWHLGSYDERAKYLERLISLNKKASSKSGSKRKREYANKYKLVHFDDEYSICKGCLLKTLGETNRFLQTINEKLKMFGRVTKSERGRAASYRKISEPRLDQVREHIKKFPAYESHYCRGKTTRKYLSPDLSVEKMYELYKSENDDPVSLTIYRSVFKKMNLSFKKPSVDTCNKCNLLQNKLKYSKSEEETEKLQNELKKHQEQYESAYEEKRKDKKTAKDSEDTCVIAFDLQQCLPTPLLSTSVAFYKRQLWVYNLTIHDFKTNHAYCYMWPESSGGRGANQIGSCLYNFIKNHLPVLHPNAKHLIMYSDSCAGQNKNSVMSTMMMILMQTSSQITTTEHKFLVPGHTHMEVDSDHALIERAKKRTSMNIHHPRDWYQLVRNASNKENKFSVIEMTHNDFYDFAEYSKKQLQVKKTNCKGEKFIWSNVQMLKYTMNQFPIFEYKERYGVDDYNIMSYAKRKKSYNEISLDSVKKCYDGPVPIAAEKKKDIISLLEYVDPSVHDFYLNVPANGDVSAAIDPDLIEEEDFYSDNF